MAVEGLVERQDALRTAKGMMHERMVDARSAVAALRDELKSAGSAAAEPAMATRGERYRYLGELRE